MRDHDATTPRGAALRSMPCFALDLLLTAAFDAREMENLLSSLSQEPAPAADGTPLSHADRVFARAHHLCHHDPRLARRIEKMLDLRHEKLMNAVEVMSIADLQALAKGPENTPNRDAAAFLWALHRDRRPKARALVGPIEASLRYRSLEAGRWRGLYT